MSDVVCTPRKKLSAKGRRFVEEYPIDFNATQAAIRAGYSQRSARSIGAELLTKPDICAALKERLDELATKATKTAEDIQAELEHLAFANMLDYMQVGFNGDPTLNFEGLTRGQAAALREVTVESFIERDPDGDEGDTRVVKRVRFKLYDKRAALIDLKRHFHQFDAASSRATVKPTSAQGKKAVAAAKAINAAEGTEWADDVGDLKPN